MHIYVSKVLPKHETGCPYTCMYGIANLLTEGGGGGGIAMNVAFVYLLI